MKITKMVRNAAIIAATASTALLSATAVADAHALDGKDPYTTGCADSISRGPAFDLDDRHGNPVGTIRLMWSNFCKTNWTEIWVPVTAYGTITVSATGKDPISYNYSAGNGGHHWGDMRYAPGICAWGNATSNNPASRGSTASRCG